MEETTTFISSRAVRPANDTSSLTDRDSHAPLHVKAADYSLLTFRRLSQMFLFEQSGRY